eukprot:g3232.t1
MSDDSLTSDEEDGAILNPEVDTPTLRPKYLDHYIEVDGFQDVENLKFYAEYKNEYCEIFNGESSVLKEKIKDICGIKQFFINPARKTKRNNHTRTSDMKGLILNGDPNYEIREEEITGYHFIIKLSCISKHDCDSNVIIANEDEICRIQVLPSDWFEDKKLKKKILDSFDLFAGIGGNAMGLDQSGIRSKVAVELCKYAAATYEGIMCEGGVVLRRDATHILDKMRDAKKQRKTSVTVLKNHDVWLAVNDPHRQTKTDKFLLGKGSQNEENDGGGENTGEVGTVTFNMNAFDVLHSSPPCSEFSGANAMNQATLHHQRNHQATADRTKSQVHYFETVPGYVECLSPPFVVVENVEAVSSELNSGSSNGVVEKLIQKLFKLEYQVTLLKMNAADYGVPQERHRYLVIAAKQGFTLPNCPTKSTSPKITCDEAISDLQCISSNSCGGLSELWKEYDVEYEKATPFQQKMRKRHVFENREQSNGEFKPDNRQDDEKRKIPIVANHYTFNRKVTGPAVDHGEIALQKCKPSKCCYGNTKMRHYDFNNNQPRLLTVREHMRLQCIPDYVVVAGKLERQFKSVNNCVPVQLAYEIGRCIVKAAGAVSDAAHINSRYENVDGNDVQDTEEEWIVHKILGHKNNLEKSDEIEISDPVRQNGEDCQCPDCSKLPCGAGIRYEVCWGERWAKEGFGRLSTMDTVNTEYWSPSFDLVMNEHIYRYAEKKLGIVNDDVLQIPNEMAENNEHTVMMMPSVAITTSTKTTDASLLPRQSVRHRKTNKRSRLDVRANRKKGRFDI